MKDNKFYLPILIILMIIFLPLTGVLTYNRVLEKNKESNPNHFPFFEGKLYFYDKNDKLVGTYLCQSDNCSIAKGIDIDDYDEYDYSSDEIKLNKQNYILINDNNNIILYNPNGNIVIGRFALVKNYNEKNGTIIVKNEAGKEGVLDYQNVLYTIPADYYYMASISSSSENFIVNDDNGWYLIDKYNNKISKEISQRIVSYDADFIYSINDDKYFVYTYNGVPFLYNEQISKVSHVNGCVVIINNGKVKIFTSAGNLLKTYGMYGQVYDYKINENIIEIYNENEIIDSFDTTNFEV